MFRRVDSAPLAPCGCMICGGTKDLADLMQEFSAQQLRLYICRVHAREIAKVFGYYKGEEQDRLMNIREELTAKERELEEQRQRSDEVTTAARELLERHETALAEYEREKQRSAQLQAQLDKVRQDTMATLAATQEEDYEPALD
jgi:DNA repair exonuclease SbcCD ATPase subunit